MLNMQFKSKCEDASDKNAQLVEKIECQNYK